jgi:hypothetical protein
MGFHYLARGFVQNQIGKIELHDAMQAWRKITKKPVEISVRGDCLRYFEQRLVLAV